jgi:AraC-like DNA-binding protein
MLMPRNPTSAGLYETALLGNPERKLFSSRDLDETRGFVGRAMKPHHLGLAGAGQRLDARMHHVSFGEVTLSRLKYGACVDILPESLDEFFLVQMPVSGHAQIAAGDESLESTPQRASVLSPRDTIRMRWSADSDQLMVRISRRRMERALASHLGREPGEPLRFSLQMDWLDSPTWQCLMVYLLQCAQLGIDAARHPLLCAQVEQLAATTLLGAQAHNHSHSRAARPALVLPRHVRKVEEYLQAHAHEAISVDQLALMSGVSLRSLYAGFKQFCGVSPMQYLKQLRLERARADLMGHSQIDTVAGIALRWGFDHLGRFAIDYKKRFGESPNETLRKRK